MSRPRQGDVSAEAVARGRIARQRRDDQFEAWVVELREHRELHNQSRFRWWAKDVMSCATHATWGRIDFTTLRHLRSLQKWRIELEIYTSSCEITGMAPPLIEAQELLYGISSDWAPIAAAVHMTELQCRMTAGLFRLAEPADQVPNQQVLRIHRMAFSNPLIRVWETKQVAAMYAAAVDVLEDTVVDLVEELRPHHHLSDILRASGTPNEDRLADRIAAQRTARGGPDDPRRIPHQTFV